MRKVTGYIGALIIVFALMGSILAGYALNINGQSVVVNEYENVTDVSGLYSHTDQKTYIDYNPASNYIGYGLDEQTYTNTANTTTTFKRISSGTVTVRPDGHVFIDNVDNGALNSDGFMFISKEVYIALSGNTIEYYSNTTIKTGITTTVTMDFNGNSFTVTGNNLSQTFTDYGIALAASQTNPDYLYNQPYSDRTVYLKSKADSIAFVLRPLGQIYNGTYYPTASFGPGGPAEYLTDGVAVANGVYQYTIPVTIDGFQSLQTFYPIQVMSDRGLGIDYTESNRVNNYIIDSRSSSLPPVTTSQRIDLANVSTTNYATANKEWIIGSTMDGGDIYGNNPDLTTQFKTGPVYSSSGSGYAETGSYKVYKFTDILTSISIPQNTTAVTMKVPVITGSLSDGTVAVRYITASSTYYRAIPYNMVVIGNYAGTYDYEVCGTSTEVLSPGRPMLPNNTNIYRTATYDVSTGLVTIYDQYGARVLTDNVNNIYIQFVSNPGNYGLYEWHNINSAAQGVGHSYFQQTPIANLDIDITTTSSSSTPIYMDITKGIKIDPSNISNTVWTNDYENGIIKVLFRAEDTYSIYHNEMIVSGNTVSVDYTGGRFFITLNGGEPVDIGTWRNIVVNLDLLAGRVTVNPVRTFNSYTNVTMDRAVIDVGDLVNSTPTTTIEWKPTANSFKFNIYSTNVFLDTYGVVMVNPSLNITNQFTNLNNFYRLDLYNFSTYGNSITVNGVTGTVSGNTVIFNDESFMLKDFSIIYADGHAYIEDSHESIDLGEITTNDISLSGVWYFETELSRGYTDLKQIYTWDWQDFIFDNVQFCVIYILLSLAGLVIARRFCTMSMIDYAVFITSIIIALGVQVIA